MASFCTCIQIILNVTLDIHVMTYMINAHRKQICMCNILVLVESDKTEILNVGRFYVSVLTIYSSI